MKGKKEMWRDESERDRDREKGAMEKVFLHRTLFW